MDPVLIFAKPGCPPAPAKEALQDADVLFGEADVTAPARHAHVAVRASGAVAVPQVSAGARLVGDAATVGALGTLAIRVRPSGEVERRDAGSILRSGDMS